MVHTQQWREGLELRGKEAVLIGSGATAITVAPEISKVTRRTHTPAHCVPPRMGSSRSWAP